jgi:hypothetical protein
VRCVQLHGICMVFSIQQRNGCRQQEKMDYVGERCPAGGTQWVLAHMSGISEAFGPQEAFRHNICCLLGHPCVVKRADDV